jgi:hypothetical protein
VPSRHNHDMGGRLTYERRIEQLESAVITRGRRVASRRRGAPAPRAIDAAVDDLLASSDAHADDLIRIRAIQEIDFHVRHVDRLLLALAPEQLRRADTGSLHALDARLRRSALHVLAVAEVARLLLGPAHDRPRAPVA